MSAKEYMEDIRKMRYRLINLKLRVEEVRTEAEGLKGLRYDLDKVQNSVTNKTTDLYVELAMIEQEYQQAMVDCLRGIAEREKLIAQLPYYQAETLRMVYMADRKPSWREVAERLQCKPRTAQRYHTKGLQQIENRLSHIVAHKGGTITA